VTTLLEEERCNAGAVASHSSTSQAQLALHDMFKENFTATQVNIMKQSLNKAMGHVLPRIMDDGHKKSELSGNSKARERSEGRKEDLHFSPPLGHGYVTPYGVGH